MRAKIESILVSSLPPEIVSHLLDTYFELKTNFYLNKHRPSELEGGLFAEAVIRGIQHLGTGTYTPFSSQLKRFDQLVKDLENLPSKTTSDSVRLHIPRSLWVIFHFRNKRSVAHLTNQINPNLCDSTLVMSVCDWVLAELIRITFLCPPEEAQRLVDDLVKRKIPIIEDFDGFPKILDPKLSVPKRILVILYEKGEAGAAKDNLAIWIKTSSNNLNMALNDLENRRAFIHKNNLNFFITKSGLKFVEAEIKISL